MKAKEVHKLSNDEIEVEVRRLRQKRYELRVQSVTEKIEDTSQFRKARKDLARLLTERSAREKKVRDEIAGKAATMTRGKP